ncbi:MAG: DUF418 domain-containing protein, partial [Actinomycetia bacterium]|nr:DUF418 domain-containing protein [Actinomycetes bacterium]
NMRAETSLVIRLRAAGRMALTNYLTQSMIGVALLTVLLAEVDLTRSTLAVFVVGVWTLQLWWSTAWLDRCRFGPAEWLWRSATNLSWQPLRHRPSSLRSEPSAADRAASPTSALQGTGKGIR